MLPLIYHAASREFIFHKSLFLTLRLECLTIILQNSMEVTEEHKKEIEKRIVERVIAELKADRFNVQDLPPIGRFVLDKIDTVTEHATLLIYPEAFTQRWPCFKSIEMLEIGEVERTKEHDTAEKVLLLSKEGKIEEALALAKTMTRK